MLSASRGELALTTLMALAVVMVGTGPLAPAEEPVVGVLNAPEGTVAPAQAVQPDLSAELPSAETEADVTPRGETLPVPESMSTEIPGAPEDAPLLLFDGGDLGSPDDGEVAMEEIGGIVNPADEVPAMVYSSGSWFRNGQWYTQLDFIMMNQRRLSRGTVPNSTQLLFASRTIPKGLLAYDTFASTTISRFSRNLSIDGLAPHFEPGTRLTLGRFLGRDAANRDHCVEFSFLGLFEWKSQLTFEGQAATFGEPAASIRTTLGGVAVDAVGNPVAIFVPGFSDADIQHFEYTSDLNSFELNYRLNGRPDADVLALQPDGHWIRHDASGRLFSFLGGLRVMSINDRFLVASESAERRSNDGNLIAPETRGVYSVRTHNDMVGVQFGGELLEKYSEWNWGLHGKVGGYVNFADRNSQIDTFNGIAPRSQKLDDETFVTALELGGFGAYHLRPNMFLRSAFDVMYLPSGTVDAQRNMGLQPTFPRLNTTGRRMYMGVSVGLEMAW